MLEIMKEKVLSTNDKAIIVSQWPTFLELIAYHLKLNGVKCDQLDGKVPVNKRMHMVDAFNDPENPLKVTKMLYYKTTVYIFFLGIIVVTHCWWCWFEFGWWKSFIFTGSALEPTVREPGARSNL